MSVASSELVRWLASIRQDVDITTPDLSELHPVGWPIPFFGDIRTARVLTIGVNPADSEFTPGTRWGEITDERKWVHRLLNYFHMPDVPWHPWFLPWETALRLIGCSYEDHTAAHLDLSPRATTPMTKAPRQQFHQMVVSDVRWLFEALTFAPRAKLVLVAGTVIQPHNSWQPISDFLKAHAPLHNVQIETATNHLRIITGDGRVSLPLFSFASGPAANDRFRLIKDVFVLRAQLTPFLR